MGGSSVIACISGPMSPCRLQTATHTYQPLPTHAGKSMCRQLGMKGKIDMGKYFLSFGEMKSSSSRIAPSAAADSSFSLPDTAEAVSRESQGGATVPGSVNEATEFAAQVAATVKSGEMSEERRRRLERAQQRQSERLYYMIAAIASTLGITAGAGAAVWYRFAYQMQSGTEIPYVEMGGTFALTVGAAVGMEFWARWAHKALWHDSLWSMHESHHRPREGPFEMNDIFAIINAGPAIALIAYGFFNKGIFPGACFGAGLGITLFGMAYMFVHDGLVHKRFPVGPIADVPYLQRVAAAHQLHHADKFDGVPYGLFLGPAELDEVGGTPDLDALLESRKKSKP